MTKTIKLTQDYIDRIFNNPLLLGSRKFHGKFDFYTHRPPSRAGLEAYKVPDVANDPTNVPIYDQNKNSETFGEIIRYEGSVENPIESYGFNFGEEIEMPTDIADKLLAAKIRIRVPFVFPAEFIELNPIEEVT